MKSKSLPVTFRLSKIDTRQFSIQEELYRSNEPVHYTTGVGFGINSSDRVFGIMISVRFHHIESPAFLVIEGGLLVQIVEESWKLIAKGGEKLKLPKDFLQHVAALSVGTLRGVLHEKTRGTSFNQFVIPTIDVTQLLDQDMVFDLNNPSDISTDG